MARAIGGVLLLWYFVRVIGLRMKGAMAPFALDGDQAQAVFQYWRYHVDGALQPGHLLTDYAFVMHAPPGWWALMASLSTVWEPLMAAKILQVVAWALLTVTVVYVVGRRTEWLVGMATAALILRSPDLVSVAAGGYARSFGPFLLVLFFGAFLAERHRVVLGVLVLQAALYPSVVVPCGLTYGVYCLVKGPMRERVQRCATLFVAGLLIIAFGKSQDIAAPAWWGSVVTMAEAEQMPAWQRGGRVPELPLKDPVLHITQNMERGFRPQGTSHAPVAVQTFVTTHFWVMLGVPALLCGVVLLVDRILRWRRRPAGGPVSRPDPDARLPWQWFALAAGVIAGYFLVRLMAFKMYLPARQLSHTVPYLLHMGVPLLAWCAARAVVGQRRWLATVLAIGLGVLPTFLIKGDGLGDGSSYVDFGADKVFFDAVRKLPLDAEIACDHYVCDGLGVFMYHHPFANRTLTHPFRKGYYDEAERRLVEMSRALYATTWEQLATFAEKEHVDYFVYTTLKLKAPEKRMYQPAKRKIDAVFNAVKGKGKVLAEPPAEAVVFRWRTFIILDLHKVRAMVQAGTLTGGVKTPAPVVPTTAPTTAPTTEPATEPARDLPPVDESTD